MLWGRWKPFKNASNKFTTENSASATLSHLSIICAFLSYHPIVHAENYILMIATGSCSKLMA